MNERPIGILRILGVVALRSFASMISQIVLLSMRSHKVRISSGIYFRATDMQSRFGVLKALEILQDKYLLKTGRSCTGRFLVQKW